jgi:hypothetical protein
MAVKFRMPEARNLRLALRSDFRGLKMAGIHLLLYPSVFKG